MDAILHAQGDEDSCLTPLILIHAISGLALPYFALGTLFDDDRPVYGISSPLLSTTSGNAEKRIPKSIPELARLYIQLIKNEIQPHGPYLLGGWSFGGVIAAEMANILLGANEEVRHVFMIDSTNPGAYPAFNDYLEHKEVTALTYNAMAERVGGTKVDIWQQDISGSRSSVSSESTSYTSSDYHLRDDIGAGSLHSSVGSASDSSDDPDEADLSNVSVLKDIRSHIGYGLHLMALSPDVQVPSASSKTMCTLIRCQERTLPGLRIRESRRKWTQKIQRDPFLGWREQALNIETLERTSHDQCFDAGHVDRLTTVLRKALRNAGM